MGQLKQLAIEREEQEFDRHLAKFLGITYDELTELDYKVETDINNTGFLFQFIFKIDLDNSPKYIVEKIGKSNYLKDGYIIYIEPWEVDYEFDYDNQYDAITHNKNYLQKFTEEIEKLRALNYLEIQEVALREVLHRQLFISVIGTMEAFLADAFINLTFDSEIFFRNFIESHPEFSKRKFELREIFEEYNKIKETAKIVMLNTIYHNLPTVSQMYRDTFKIEFPPFNNVYKYILKRHDLVHRNGKTKDGLVVIADEKTIKELIEDVTIFIYALAIKLKIT